MASYLFLTLLAALHSLPAFSSAFLRSSNGHLGSFLVSSVRVTKTAALLIIAC